MRRVGQRPAQERQTSSDVLSNTSRVPTDNECIWSVHRRVRLRQRLAARRTHRVRLNAIAHIHVAFSLECGCACFACGYADDDNYCGLATCNNTPRLL